MKKLLLVLCLTFLGVGIASASPECPCDLNNDGICDEKDGVLSREDCTWGDCTDPNDCPCDLNNDDKYDGADLIIHLQSFVKPQCRYGICTCAFSPDSTTLHRGDTLSFDVSVTNLTKGKGYVGFETKVTKPNKVQTGVIRGPFNIGLDSDQTRSGYMTHTLPPFFPLGIYTYQGYVGLQGMGIIAECEFDFEVVE